MSIIHQNYQNLLNKIFKNVIQTQIASISFKNYVELVMNLNNEVFRLARKTLVNFFEILDENFKNSKERKEKYYTKGKSNRYLVTIFGEISFEREYYVPINDSNSNEEKGFFFVDKFIGLKSSDTYDSVVKALLMEAKVDQSFQKAADQISKLISLRNDRDIHISRQTVFNIFKNWELDLNINKFFDNPIDNEKLYIILDEKYISSQDSDKESIMVKHAVIYTGKTKIADNRNKLNNKITISSTDSVFAFADRINSIIDLNYTNIKELIISGDGANWIKSCYSNICTCDRSSKMFVLDKFHCCQAINHITKDDDYKNILYEYLFGNKKDDFIALCQIIINNNLERKDIINDKLNYILSNWNAIQKINNSSFIGCPMESHIANDLAKPFARDPKAYKRINLTKHIILRYYQLNNVNIFNLFLNSENQDLNQNFTSTLNTTSKLTNIPVLESNNSNIRNYVYNMCHNLNDIKPI